MSEIRANTIANAAGTGPADLTGQSASKAWVDYDQSTPSVRSSFNVASVTDNGAGDATVNFSNSFSTSSPACTTSTAQSSGSSGFGSNTTTSVKLFQYNSSGALVDNVGATAIFGDLA